MEAASSPRLLHTPSTFFPITCFFKATTASGKFQHQYHKTVFRPGSARDVAEGPYAPDS